MHNGIAETRAAIARLKAALPAHGVALADQPADAAPPTPPAHDPAAVPRTRVDVQLNAGMIAAGGTATGLGIQHLSGQEIHFHSIAPPPPTDPLPAALARLAELPLDTIPDPAPLPTHSRMPLRRNPLFVGREEDLHALAAALKGGGAAVITTGIGGVGKTQLAAEFAHRYGQFFAGGVFWLSFADPAGIDSEIAACGGASGLELYRDADRLTQAEQVARVQYAWQQPLPRLLIFDNCDDQADMTAETLLAARLPPSGGCWVLITSRRGQWRQSLRLVSLPLGVLGRAESVALLRSYRDDLEDSEAGAIAAELGDLPLALTLAGSYLEIYRDEPFGAPAIYLAQLRKLLLDHRSLQGTGVPLSLTGHELNVRATFELSYRRLDAVDGIDALAIAALSRAACLAPGEPFPRDLLLAIVAADRDTSAEDDEEVSMQRADALRRLVALGLLEAAEGGALHIHRLITAFARAAMQDEAARGRGGGADQASLSDQHGRVSHRDAASPGTPALCN